MKNILYINKVFLGGASKLANFGFQFKKKTSRWVYIPLAITDTGNKDNPGHIDIVALHDSECAQSVLRTDVLHEMIKQGISVRLVPTPPKFTVVTAAGVKHTPDGLARIQITFNKDTDNELSYPVTVIVYKHLSQQFLLGRDFTGSQYKICETNDYMYFGASQQHGIQGIPTDSQIHDNQACRVTLITTSGYAPKYVRSNRPLTIPRSHTKSPIAAWNTWTTTLQTLMRCQAAH